jgi:hypothetical protein
MSLLTTDQKREFTRSGFLVLDGVLDEETVTEAREAVEADDVPRSWEHLEELIDTPDEDLPFDAEGRNVKMHSGDFKMTFEDDVFGRITERLYPYAEELVGEGRLQDPSETGRIVLRFPQRDALTAPGSQQASEIGSHIDGVNVGSSMPTVGVATYLNRIQPRGGGFTVWPGSHHLVGKYYREAADDIYAGDGGIPALSPDGSWESDRQLSEQFDPIEVHGDPGTVVLWHGHMEHTGGINLSPGTVRMGLFTRFNLREDLYDDVMEYARHPIDFWEGLRDVEMEPMPGYPDVES